MIHVSVGSNIDPEIHVPRTIARMQGMMRVAGVSPFYRVPAIDRPEQADYWNGVVAIAGDVSEVAALLHTIEAEEGRVRTQDKWAARTIDLDLLLIDGAIVDDDLRSRPFLARCLAALGALPAGITDPGEQWPVAWDGQTEH